MLALNIFSITTPNFKKFGKKMQKQRKGDIDRIVDRLSDIAKEETNRAKDIFEEHKKVLTPKKQRTPSKKTSIDFYEK
jgi:hypothetical protein